MTTPTAPDLRTAVGAALAVDWDGIDDEELAEVMVELERTQALLDAAKVEVARRLLGSRTLSDRGWSSAKDFLTAVAGGAKGSGPGLVRLVERLDAMTRTREAFATGSLARPKAEVITAKVATLPFDATIRARAEELLLELAGTPGDAGLDATELARAWPDVVRRLDPDGTLLGSVLDLDRRERAAHQGRFLALTPDGLGGVRLRGYGPLEDAERLKAALHPLAAPVRTEPGACGGVATGVDGERLLPLHPRRRPCPEPGCAHDGRDPRDHGARLYDALLTTCDQQAAAPAAPGSHGAPPRLVVTLAYDDLARTLDPAGIGRVGNGDLLSAQSVRRIACDAEIIPAVLGGRSEILDVGRSQRLVTTALWHALVLRDGECVFPGCTRPPQACDAHHIQHWADGGVTALDNLVLLCRHHHTVTHHSPWTVAIDPDTRRPVWRAPPGGGARIPGRHAGSLDPPLARAG